MAQRCKVTTPLVQILSCLAEDMVTADIYAELCTEHNAQHYLQDVSLCETTTCGCEGVQGVCTEGLAATAGTRDDASAVCHSAGTAWLVSPLRPQLAALWMTLEVGALKPSPV